MKYGKNFVFFMKLYKNHIFIGYHGNKYGQKIILGTKYIFDMRFSFYGALERIS